eukprot:scaffold16104_cov47-Phaeocystis_antarctica.AAC.2
MVVTLEVSKLSGWLNADVRCRESKGGHTLRDDVRGMWEAGGGGRPRCTHSVQARARLQMKQGTRGGAHVEHVAHVRDAGGVEAQRLVERIRALPRVETGHTVRGKVRAGWREGGGRSRCTQRAGEGSTADMGQGTGRSAP